MYTRGMRAYGERGLGTQIDLSKSRVHSPEPIIEPEPVTDSVKNTSTMKEEHQEPTDDTMS